MSRRFKRPIFDLGDLVEVQDHRGFGDTSDFKPTRKAIVIYYDLHHPNDFELFFENTGGEAWFEYYKLRLIEHGREDLLEQWENNWNNLLHKNTPRISKYLRQKGD